MATRNYNAMMSGITGSAAAAQLGYNGDALGGQIGAIQAQYGSQIAAEPNEARKQALQTQQSVAVNMARRTYAGQVENIRGSTAATNLMNSNNGYQSGAVSLQSGLVQQLLSTTDKTLQGQYINQYDANLTGYRKQIGQERLGYSVSTNSIEAQAGINNLYSERKDTTASIKSIEASTQAAIEGLQADPNISEKERNRRITSLKMQGKSQIAMLKQDVADRFAASTNTDVGLGILRGEANQGADDKRFRDMLDAEKNGDFGKAAGRIDAMSNKMRDVIEATPDGSKTGQQIADAMAGANGMEEKNSGQILDVLKSIAASVENGPTVK